MSSENATPFTRHDPSRLVCAPRGAAISCRSWQTEAALRMLMNNLDREVAERPEDLVVYGGIGRAARSWECFDKIVEVLRRLGGDETLLVQSGKPVGVFKTHADAPRVLIANSNLVPHWATWEKFNELDRRGLMMYGQMTAGSWIYIGSQGIVQGTCETFGAAGKKHFGGVTAGRWILTGGLGGMGGAQPLAATMAGFSMLAVECDATRIAFRLRTRYLDREARSLDEALAALAEAKSVGRALSVGLVGNAADIFDELVRRNIVPDLVTDQTSAHDTLNGYLPQGWTIEQWKERRASDPRGTVSAAKKSMAVQVRAMLEFRKRGAAVFDYGNNIRQMAFEEGVADAFAFPGFVPAYIRPLFCEGIGPFRWVALSGDPEDIRRTDAKVKELIPGDAHLHRWLEMAGQRIAFQGLPARICWLGLKHRARVGLAFNAMVASGELKAPIVIGRDHLDSGSVASPNRETEGMLDGSDAVSDWPLLNGMLNVAGGATWVSIHHGGGVGMGFSQHAGLVIVCDGTPDATRRIGRVLRNDPGTGVMRHADAGYESAVQCARENKLDLPGITTIGSLPPKGGTTSVGTTNELVIAPGKMVLAEIRRVAFEPGLKLSIDSTAWPAVDAAAEAVKKVVAEERVTYGINTGFGQLASERISHEDIEKLQRNLVLSHAAGVGEPLKPAAVRLILALKINSLMRGYSGVRRAVIDALISLFNAGVLPVIPAKGSVGASGDLAPLAHLACVLIGEGEAFVDGKRMAGREALTAAKLKPIQLVPKEGLALLNGTQASTALALLGVFAAEDLFAAAVVAGSLSVEAALGSRRPFDARIQEVRGHRGQIDAARAYRELLGASSEIGDSHAHCNKVQDPYSLRCQPQVMGACLTQMRQAAEVLASEANAVSDNPLVFAEGNSSEIISGGNFHGEPVAFAADNLALAFAEIGAMSERRIAMLIDKNLSSGLPAFLVEHGGVNSGFMLAQVTAAALASENKTLAHPASVDSIPTSANQEDHVSMATFAARRLAEMAENTTGIVAIEWLAACQGLDFRAPLKSSARLEEARALLRAKVPFYDRDRLFAPDIAKAGEWVRSGICARFMAPGILMSR